MNYLKIYKKIIQNSEARENNITNKKCCIYSEKHHVLPKSINNIDIAKQILGVNDKDKTVLVTLREHFILHLLLVKIFYNINKNCYIKMIYAFNLMNSRTKGSKKYAFYKEEYKKILSKRMKGKQSPAKGKKWSNASKEKAQKNSALKGKTYEEVYGHERALHIKNIRSYKSKKYWNNTLTNKNVDQTFYIFYNNITNKYFIGRIIDIFKLYGIRVNCLKNGDRKTVKGWSILHKMPIIRNHIHYYRINKIYKKDFDELIENKTKERKVEVYEVKI